MAERDFYNINNFIAYPLVWVDDTSSSSSGSGYPQEFDFIGGGQLPRQGIVDAGFMFGLNSGFVVATHNVMLYSVEVTVSDVLFDFRSDAPGLSGYRWLFSFPLGTSRGCVDYVDATPIGGGSGDRQRGYGYLNIGDLAEIEALGVGLYLLANLPQIEPALLQSLIGSVVESISLADDFRLCPTECCASSSSSSSSSSDGIDDAFLDASGLVGALKFKEGYNAQIQVDPVLNAIIIGAGIGLGAGQTCHDMTIDQNGIFLDVCQDCQSFIRSVNGRTSLTGGLSLVGGPGVTVVAGSHKLTVRMDVTQLCLLSSSSSQSSNSSSSSS